MRLRFSGDMAKLRSIQVRWPIIAMNGSCRSLAILESGFFLLRILARKRKKTRCVVSGSCFFPVMLLMRRIVQIDNASGLLLMPGDYDLVFGNTSALEL